ncbi:MAG: hypothetical protein LBB36_02360 [Fibromonadaceae bacterium]|jgi:hypothetical protein|nr:hypothetical protein [Fibromonadaceae bacterium]
MASAFEDNGLDNYTITVSLISGEKIKFYFKADVAKAKEEYVRLCRKLESQQKFIYIMKYGKLMFIPTQHVELVVLDNPSKIDAGAQSRIENKI